MPTATVKYLGGLRTECTHLQSGTVIHTDAPTDNHGKGEAFSPTDLLANALGSCMISIMAIKSKDLDLDLTGSTIDVTKIMQAEPRKIAKIEIENSKMVIEQQSLALKTQLATSYQTYLTMLNDMNYYKAKRDACVADQNFSLAADYLAKFKQKKMILHRAIQTLSFKSGKPYAATKGATIVYFNPMVQG